MQFIEQKIRECIELIDWLHDQLHSLNVPPENHVPCALYYISMQHASGALILLLEDRHAPAFALLRPIYETYMRSVWYSVKASDNERLKVSEDFFPSLKLIVESIKNDDGAVNIIKQYENIKVFNSYIHGGVFQIFNHLNDTSLESSFTYKDKLKLIDFSVRLAIASSIQFCFLIQASQTSDRILEKVRPIYGK